MRDFSTYPTSRLFNRGVALAILLAACGGKEAPPPADTTAVAVQPAGPERVAATEGFSTPESVLYDAEQQVWFVSNINGGPSAKDNNGFISRLTDAGAVDSLHFIQGGRDRATLNAPKGMAITGDTLWVTDITAVRGFNRKTGAPVATIEFGKRALFLNDIAFVPGRGFYITDTGIIIADSMSHPGPDRIFHLAGRKFDVAAEGPHFEAPNGIVYDSAGQRLIVVPFAGTTIFAGKEARGAMPLAVGPGQMDGVVVLDGDVLVSSWADSAVVSVGPEGRKKIITGVPNPADMGLDVTGRRLAIPLFTLNRVEFWKLP